MMALHGCVGLVRWAGFTAGIALGLACCPGDARASGIAARAMASPGPGGGYVAAPSPGAAGLTPASLVPPLPAITPGLPLALPGTNLPGLPIMPPPPPMPPPGWGQVWPIAIRPIPVGGSQLITVSGLRPGGDLPGRMRPFAQDPAPQILAPSAAEAITTPEPSTIVSALVMVGLAAAYRHRASSSA